MRTQRMLLAGRKNKKKALLMTEYERESYNKGPEKKEKE